MKLNIDNIMSEILKMITFNIKLYDNDYIYMLLFNQESYKIYNEYLSRKFIKKDKWLYGFSGNIIIKENQFIEDFGMSYFKYELKKKRNK